MLSVEAPVVEDGGHRVVGRVGGAPLWFASEDVALVPSLEGFASATVLSAAFAGERLALPAPVDATWLDGVTRALRVFARWWNVSPAPPRVPGRIRLAAGGSTTALLFTAGVDSFHTLLTRPRRPDLLVFVHGYDVALGDVARGADVAARVRDVAAALGVRAAVVRTNLRQHPLLHERGTWEEVHGGALAAVGHLLGAPIGRLVISSSFSRRWHVPWGSHFRTDHLWSSDAVAVEHYGAHCNRTEKIAAIADDALVQRHLLVCWEHRSPSGNCGACPKCTVTMAALAQVGRLDDARTLVPVRPLAELLAQDGVARFWQALREIVARDPTSPIGRTVAARLPAIAPPRPRRLHAWLDDVAVRWHARPRWRSGVRPRT